MPSKQIIKITDDGKFRINGRDQLIQYVASSDRDKLIDHRERKGKRSLDVQETEIRKKTFTNIVFSGRFLGIDVKGCKFIDCEFEGVWAFFFILKKCSFRNCFFRSSVFTHNSFMWDDVTFTDCSFRTVEWHESGLVNIFFDRCSFRNMTFEDANPVDNVIFSECTIEWSQFAYMANSPEDLERDRATEFYDLRFDHCKLLDTTFNAIELRNSVFENCELYKCAFMDCVLAADTFEVDKAKTGNFYASMDFQTILKSERLDKRILKLYFNVNESTNLQEVIGAMTGKIEFKSVFISYSFKDKVFADRVNRALIKKGIKTFLWEKDAPGGKRLEDIMTSGVRRHDKVLFIASEHSIRSKACQFELSEGRRIQEAIWQNIFIPLHIDDYLFSVQKSDIRPLDRAQEYWENIEELRSINSIDFRGLNGSAGHPRKFNAAMSLVVDALKNETRLEKSADENA